MAMDLKKATLLARCMHGVGGDPASECALARFCLSVGDKKIDKPRTARPASEDRSEPMWAALSHNK